MADRYACPTVRNGDDFDWVEELMLWAEARNVGVAEIVDKHPVAPGWVQVHVRLGLGAEEFYAEVSV